MLSSARILSIDPGTSYTGMVILDIDNKGNISIPFASTVQSSNHIDKTNTIAMVHGDRFAKINHIGNVFSEVLQIYKPNVIAIKIK